MSLGLGLGGSDTSSSQQQQQQTNQQTVGSQQGNYSNGPVNSAQIIDALNSAGGIFANGNPTLNAGMAGVNAGAAGATSLYGAANPAITDTLNGAYTAGGTGNPFFTGAFQGVADQIRPTVDSSFESGGRYGSGAADFAKASALTNAGAAIGFGNYTQERQNQVNTIAGLPSYAAGLTQPGQAQLGAGYLPINQFIQQLATLSPGTTGNYNQASNTNVAKQSTMTGSGDSSTFGWNANAQAKPAGQK